MPPSNKPAMRGHGGPGNQLGSDFQTTRTRDEYQRRARRLQADARHLIGASEHASLALAAHFGARADAMAVMHG